MVILFGLLLRRSELKSRLSLLSLGQPFRRIPAPGCRTLFSEFEIGFWQAVAGKVISIRHGAASFAVLCGGLRLDPLCHLLDNHRHCRAGTG